jgi:hypothetical protein
MAPVNVLRGLDLFEQLLVNAQACDDSARWLVAMHEGLLPMSAIRWLRG